MESLMDQILVPRILVSLIAVVISVGPMFADFNKTHATNPAWTPHARFHVVWQVLSQAGVSLVVLYLLWAPSADPLTHLWLGAILTSIWIVSFFSTMSTMSLFGGTLADVNGIKPFKFNILGKVRLVDTNLFGATLLTCIMGIVFYLLASLPPAA